MRFSMDCKMDIAAQSTGTPTYTKIDCDLQTTTSGISSLTYAMVDCDLAIVRTLADACINWDQGIRTTVTIDGVDVTDALIGAINISRRKNQIATFSFQLGDSTYSPLTNSHIVPNKVVVITSYINSYEAKLFTGLIDDASASWSGDFSVTINGSGYGKKLRDTRKTLVSVQDSANSKFRYHLIKCLVEQAGIIWAGTAMPLGSYTRIDHSFEDQTILDMVTKELVIDSMRWEFDEEANFQASYDRVKTNVIAVERRISLPLWTDIVWTTPDWAYGEDKFFYLGLRTTDDNIINDVKILGTIYETQIEVEDSPSGEWIDPDADDNLFSIERTLTLGESILNWGSTGYIEPTCPFQMEVHDGIYHVAGGYQQPTYWYGKEKFYYYTFDITWEGQLRVDNYLMTCTDGFEAYSEKKGGDWLRFVTRRYLDGSMQGKAGSVRISLGGKWIEYPDIVDDDPDTSAVIDNEEVNTPTYEYEYDQVAAHVTDFYSIVKYGRRKPNSEGTLEFPLAENTSQCRGIGRKIIKDSHRFTKQPDFEIPFNPLLKVGQTISITDKKIGYSQRWYVEEVNHTIEQGKGRTRIGCVYYP